MHIWRHLCTIMRHKHYVFIHCAKAGIPFQGIFHDTSKFCPVEFFTSARFYTGTCSPIPSERREYGYSKVWMHHVRHNKHHMEYWFDNIHGEGIPVKMPLRYLKEMFCDMIAASKVYTQASGRSYTDSEPLEYFCSKGMGSRMHSDSRTLLIKLLSMLAEDGESNTFSYIKKLKDRDY